jgi:hypothetical protein
MRFFRGRCISLVLALGLLAGWMPPVRAEPYHDALAHFTADSFDQTIEGINATAASGNALAVTVIGALQEGRLLFDANSKRVFIREGSTMPRTGSLSPAAGLPTTCRRCGSTTGCAA